MLSVYVSNKCCKKNCAGLSQSFWNKNKKHQPQNCEVYLYSQCKNRWIPTNVFLLLPPISKRICILPSAPGLTPLESANIYPLPFKMLTVSYNEITCNNLLLNVEKDV